MLKDFSIALSKNKNLLMFLTSIIYMISVYSVLSNNLLLMSFLLAISFIILFLKNLLSFKYVIVWTLVFIIGVANTSFRLKSSDVLLSLAPTKAVIEGTIVSIPQGKTELKAKFFCKVNKIYIDSKVRTFDNEKILININKNINKEVELDKLKIYNTYSFVGKLSPPFKAGNPSQFDYSTYLRNHNAYAVFYANQFEYLHSPKGYLHKFMQCINNYREWILNIHSKYLNSPNLEILGGIVFGDDAVSPPENIKSSFVNSGLLHILAASGMNVALIYGFFFVIMSFLRINFKVKVSIGMIMVVIYSLMTGLGASVVRATFMMLFVLIGKLIDRDSHSISLLSFVALLMLLYNPMYIADVGFQLSFIVTFGILLMSPNIPKSKNFVVNNILPAIFIPVIAQLWVIPIQIFYFNNISIYSVFANIMSVPILSVISFGGFISSLVSIIKPIADVVCRIFDFIVNPFISLLVNVSDFWGQLPNATIQTMHPSVLQIAIYYFFLLSISFVCYKDLREKYLSLLLKLISIFLFLLFLSLLPINNKNLEITVFDVGNADSFLIKTPANDYIMIDTGKSAYKSVKSQADIIILKYLLDAGIKNIKSLIITHFDNDHCGGAIDVMTKVKVGELYVNDSKHNSVSAKMIYETANKHNITLKEATNNEIVYDNDGLKLINLKMYNGKNDNDNSIINLLTYNNYSFLFTDHLN